MASWSGSTGGRVRNVVAGPVTCWAQVAPIEMKTEVPTWRLLTSSPTSTTRPIPSPPGVLGKEGVRPYNPMICSTSAL